jgi:hypothetical protein
MKSLSGTSKVVVVTTIAVLTVLSFRSFAQPGGGKPPPPERKLTLKFKDAQVRSEDGFKAKVCGLSSQQYQVHMKHSDASKPDEDWPPCPPAKTGLKTDKVTTSAIVKNESPEELTVIGPHVTQAITSASKAEIQSILDEFP